VVSFDNRVAGLDLTVVMWLSGSMLVLNNIGALRQAG